MCIAVIHNVPMQSYFFIIFRLLLLGIAVSITTAFKDFQTKIPNGDRVPDPSIPNTVWQGVGHLNALGGGDRNVFGQDFKANGLVSEDFIK